MVSVKENLPVPAGTDTPPAERCAGNRHPTLPCARLSKWQAKQYGCTCQGTGRVAAATPPPVAEQLAPTAAPDSGPAPSTFDALQEGLAGYKAGYRPALPLDSIVVTSNTRQVFDEAEMNELADSIRTNGVMQAVLVRPYAAEAGKFELVFGGRRYRAAGLAGLTEIPATVRHLTDREFLEMQVTENLQRKDVRPADEAVAFAKLLDNGFSAEEIGLKVGKKARFVSQRAQLATLAPFWLTALQEERLPLVGAVEIARLPEASQGSLEAIAKRDYHLARPGATFTGQWVKSSISQYILRDLNAAAFPKADAKLCPAAGACTTCPKRSGAVRQLFDEQELKHDLCLDAACFEQKKTAFVGRRKKELGRELGKPVVLVSSNSYQVPAGTLPTQSYSVVKPERAGAVQALMVDGPEAGLTKWVSVPTVQERTAQQRTDRSAEIRTGKLNEASRGLLAGHLYAQALTNGHVLEQHVDAQLAGELRSQGGPHTALRLVLVHHFGWEMPEGGEKALRKLTPQSQGQALGTWMQANLARLGYAEKLALYFALLGYNCSVFDSTNRRLTDYAKQAGADLPDLMRRATEAVDGPKARGQQAAIDGDAP